MKIIDEKGRLFGRVNVIDFLVILFLVCMLPAFYFGYKIMIKKPVVVETPKKEFLEIETDCRFIKLEPEILKFISVGSKELDENGEVIGKIITLAKSEPYTYEIDIGTRQKITKIDPDLKQLKAKLKLKVELMQNSIYYKNKIMKIGSPFEFRTNKCCLSAIISEEELTKVVATITVRFKNLMPELSRLIKTGNRQIEIVEPNIKKIVARVVRVVSNEPAEFISLIPEGRSWSIVGHPKKRDLVLEIETLCMRKPEGLFLGSRPVKVGRPFEFSTDLYTISGTIIRIEQK